MSLGTELLSFGLYTLLLQLQWAQGNLRQDRPTLGLNNVHVYDIMHSAYCKDQQCQK